MKKKKKFPFYAAQINYSFVYVRNENTMDLQSTNEWSITKFFSDQEIVILPSVKINTEITETKKVKNLIIMVEPQQQ